MRAGGEHEEEGDTGPPRFTLSLVPGDAPCFWTLQHGGEHAGWVLGELEFCHLAARLCTNR